MHTRHRLFVSPASLAALAARLAAAVVVIALSVPALAHQAAPSSASPSAARPTRAAIEAAARTVIARARYASFVSMDDAGQPQARIVDPFAPERDFTIWVATNAQSRKAAQVAAHPKVTLLYFDADGKNEVTLLGRASLVTDAAAKAAHWKDDWAAFYANKNLGPDYLLMRVVPETLEISAPSLGMTNDPVTWKPVTLKLR